MSINVQNVAAEIGGTIAVGTVMLGVLKMWVKEQTREVRSDTSQLQRNGGSTVADAAVIARDSSLRTEKALADHLIQSAAANASQDAKIEILFRLIQPGK